MTNQRQRPVPADLDELLQQLPARVVLDRMHSPVISIGSDGVLAYANPAFADMLGYLDVGPLVGQPLPTLLAGHSHSSAEDCLAMLRDAGKKIVEFCDADGFPIRTSVSAPLLLRTSDSFMLLSVSDVTELLWS